MDINSLYNKGSNIDNLKKKRREKDISAIKIDEIPLDSILG